MAEAFANLRIDLKAMDELSDRLQSVSRFVRGEKAGVDRFAQQGAEVLAGHVRDKIFSSTRGKALVGARTGALARSYRAEWKVDRRGVTMSARSDLPYARIQDRGGRIFPSKRRLAIPLITEAVNRWPRSWPRGVLFRRGNALSRRVGNGKYQNVYALAKSVKIEPKHYINKAKEAASPEIVKLLLNAIMAEARKK